LRSVEGRQSFFINENIFPAMAMASSFPVKRGPGLFRKFDGRTCRRDGGQLTDKRTDGQTDKRTNGQRTNGHRTEVSQETLLGGGWAV